MQKFVKSPLPGTTDSAQFAFSSKNNHSVRHNFLSQIWKFLCEYLNITKLNMIDCCASGRFFNFPPGLPQKIAKEHQKTL